MDEPGGHDVRGKRAIEAQISWFHSKGGGYQGGGRGLGVVQLE